MEGSDDNDSTPCIHHTDKQPLKESAKTYQSVNTYECFFKNSLDDVKYHCNASNNNHVVGDGDDNGVSVTNGVECDEVVGGVLGIDQFDSGITRGFNGDEIKQGEKFNHNDWERSNCGAYVEDWKTL